MNLLARLVAWLDGNLWSPPLHAVPTPRQSAEQVIDKHLHRFSCCDCCGFCGGVHRTACDLHGDVA